MADKTQKKGMFSKVVWANNYYKGLQNKLINRSAVLIGICIIVAVVLAYMGQAVWASRFVQVVVLLVGVIIGNVIAIQIINKNDLQGNTKKKGK